MGPVDPRLLQRSPAARRFLAVTVVLGLLATVATFGQAWFVAHGVASAFAGDDLRPAAAGLAACLALRGLLDWWQSVVSVRAAADVKAGLRHDLVAAVLDPRRLEPLPDSARLATLVGGGLDRLDGYVARFLPQLVLAALTPPAVVAALLVVDPLSALVVVLTVPLVLVFLVLVGLVTRDRTDRRWHELARLGRHFSEVLNGLTTLTALGRHQERGLREVGERHRRITMETLRTAFLSAL
ncbi:MAG: thiol reductant ABC exporter subunit CydD, partial [Actinomycetales bacterium]